MLYRVSESPKGYRTNALNKLRSKQTNKWTQRRPDAQQDEEMQTHNDTNVSKLLETELERATHSMLTS